MNPPRAGIDAPLASSPTQLEAKGLGFEHSREPSHRSTKGWKKKKSVLSYLKPQTTDNVRLIL